MQEAIEILKSAYQRKRHQKKSFTLKFLAGKVGVSTTFVSLVFRGQRSIPLAMVDSLCDQLDLDSEQRNILFQAAVRGRSRMKSSALATVAKENTEFPKLPWVYQPADYFWVLENPIYLAILNCTLLKGYDGTEEFLAERLRLPIGKVKEMFAELAASPFLSTQNGKLVKSELYNDFSSEVSKSSIRKFHHSLLARAETALAVQTSPADMDARLITSAVLTVPAKRVVWAKQQIQNFLAEMVKELAAGDEDEVYQLGVHFLPFTSPAEGAPGTV